MMINKIKYISVFVVMVAVFSACNKQKILSEKEMENILFEMHFADGIVYQAQADGHIKNADSIVRYADIFRKYNCTRDDFERSIRAYSQDKDAFEKIYNNIKFNLEELRKQYEENTFNIDAILDKIKTPINSFITPIERYFDSTENVKDVAVKILEFIQNVPQILEQDSIAKLEPALEDKTDSAPEIDKPAIEQQTIKLDSSRRIVPARSRSINSDKAKKIDDKDVVKPERRRPILNKDANIEKPKLEQKKVEELQELVK